MRRPFGSDVIDQIAPTPDIQDPIEGTREYECALTRDASTHRISAMPWLPQLPDAAAAQLYERIEDAERRFAAPNLSKADYENGTANEPDERAFVRGLAAGGYLFTAEHATSPKSLRTGKMRFADAGTAGLAAVLAEDNGTAIIMRGRQTSNVPSALKHPIRQEIARELAVADGFLSIHGKAPGMFVHQADRAEIHACIGLGLNPSDILRDFAYRVAKAARDDLGLYVVVSNDQPAYIQERGGTAIKRNEDGTPKLSQLAGIGVEGTTTTIFSHDILDKMGRQIPAFQIELTNLLRWTPKDGENTRKDRISRIIGVAMGYRLFQKVVELAPTYGE